MITKNILINLISLFQGGPKTVCTGLLEGIEDFLITNRETTFYLMTPSIPDILEKVDSLQKKFGVNIVHIPLNYPTKHFNFIFKLYYDHYLTAKYAEKNNVDFIFMTANFASLFSRKKQLVLLHNSHYFEKRNPFSRFSLKIRYFLEKKLFYFTLIKKPHYIVQTNVMKEGLHKFCNVASYKAHALYMMPPRVFTNSAESYGFPYIEAIICNKAIATTDSNFSRELLGNNGYYFELNANSIFEKINEFINHPKQISYNILKYIPTWKDYIKKIIEVYKIS
jgi:hypothetical protein